MVYGRLAPQALWVREDECGWADTKKDEGIPPRLCARLFDFFPDHVFIVSAINQRVNFAAAGITEQPAAFNALAEEDVRSFREKLLFRTVTALRVQMVAFDRDGHDGPGRQFVRSDIFG